MTFEEFKETRFECRDLGAALEMDMGVLEPVAGNVYCGSLYIEEVQERTPNGYPNEHRALGKWHLVIENSTEIGNDLETFERRLYDWAVASGYSVPPMDKRIDLEIEMLCREYAAWNERNNLNLGSADEHLHDETLTAEQQAWVRDFSSRWENSAPVHINGGVVPGRLR
jgi:hypothetical protein